MAATLTPLPGYAKPGGTVERGRFAEHHRRMKSLVMLLSIAMTGTAAAAPGDPTFDSLSMGRLTPISTVSFEFGYEIWDEPDAVDINIFTLNFAGHFVSRRGYGGYFVLPLTYLDLDIPLVIDDSDMAVGNVEVGGLFTKFFGRTALVFHGGFALPTAQEDGAAGYQFFGAFTRLSDAALHVTNSTWARLGFSPMGRSGNFLWRADIGLDLALDEDNNNEYSPILYLNVGGGVDVGSAQLLVELVNVFSGEDDADDDGSTLSLGARFTSGSLRPGIGLLLPIDFDGVDFEAALLASMAVRL